MLTDFSVSISQTESDETPTQVPFAHASADWNQPDFPIANAIDTEPATGWAINDGDSDDRIAVFESAKPFGYKGGTTVRVRIAFESQYAQHTIGKLRLSVSESAESLPAKFSVWEVSSLVPTQDRTAAFALDPTSPQLNEATWTQREEFVDGKVHMLPAAVGTTFLRRTINAPSARPLQIALGSDDGIKVFLNGSSAFARDVARPVAANQDRATLDLTAGPNDLVLAISNHGGGHGFFFRIVGEDILGVPNALARALRKPEEQRSVADRDALREHFRRRNSPEWTALEAERTRLEDELTKLDREIPRTLVMRERTEPRPAHVLIRGKYDQLGEPVTPGVLSALPELTPQTTTDGETSRLALAHWLVDPNHPLTARVTVNRFWQSLFGVGIVKTAGDFGSQGEWPSHPALLDWLAREFVDSGWGRQATVPHHRDFGDVSAVGARSAERLRRRPPAIAGSPAALDSGSTRRGFATRPLALGGLLVEEIGGPSVKPYQPLGLWRAVAYTSSNTSKFVADTGSKLYRRSLYTFWKRTSPPPTLQSFSAPTA